MYDYRELLVSAIRNDATLAPLLGSTLTDPRVYAYYQPDADINGTDKRAYITYAMTGYPTSEHRATGDPVWTLAIWAINWSIVEQVRDRLEFLFEEKGLTTPAGRQVHGTRLGEHDSFQENTKFSGRQLQFRLAFSKV